MRRSDVLTGVRPVSPGEGSVTDLGRVLFSPRSVAIVGQSNDPGKTAGRPLKYLRQAGFAGAVFPVNARRENVLGERAWPSLSALPEVPEHVYIVAPTEAAMTAVEECGALGVPVATVLANGFGEAGPEGAAREARLKETCARTGLRLVGPSSLGVVDLRHRLLLTANAAFDEPDLPVGRVFAASHSGSMIGALLSRGKARGVGFAGLVSVGNEVDLSIGEICAATLSDPEIDGYLLFLEHLRHAHHLAAFAAKAAALGRPVVAYKLGRSAEARELAVSHTGALAGDDIVADAFLADCGIARVETLEGLMEALPLARRLPIVKAGARPPAVGVVTTTAGGAAMVLDRVAANGVNVAMPGAETRDRLAAAGIETAPMRLVDLTTAGTRYDVMKAALDILTTAPEFDLILAVVGSSARFHPELAVRPIIDSAGSRKPLAAFLVPDAPEALARLKAAGVPSFYTPEACADAIVATLRRRPPKPGMARFPARAHRSPGRMLDELEAGTVLDRLGIARTPAVAIDVTVTQAPALPFPYPVAVKALSSAIPHKTDVGGVVLGVADGDALIAAIGRIRQSLAAQRPDVPLARVLVQPMIAGLGEALIGYRVDPDVGPLVMVAAGGIGAELHADRSLRVAPVDLATAHAMIGEVRTLRQLAGYRGRPAGDMPALAQAIVALSNLAAQQAPSILEAEINPLMLRAQGEGVVALDALVTLA